MQRVRKGKGKLGTPVPLLERRSLRRGGRNAESRDLFESRSDEKVSSNT